MRPILKNQRKLIKKGQAYKETLPKLPLRVTFILEQSKDSTKIKQKRTINPTNRKGCKINQSQSTLSQSEGIVFNCSSGNLNEQNLTQVESSSQQWDNQNEFRRENTQWNNFILIYNPQFTSNSFYCGKCSKSFTKVVQFIFHCLSQCKEICHSQSSHFILQINQWKAFLAKQIQKDKKQQPQKAIENQPIQENLVQTENEIKSQEPNQKEQPALVQRSSRKKGGKVQNQDKDKIKQIYQFSIKTIQKWKNLELQKEFVWDKNYFQLYNLILVINPLHQNFQKEQIRNCDECTLNFKTKKVWLIYHYQQKCTKLNNENNRILFLNAKLFYKFCYQTNRYNLGQKKNIDLSFLVYLYENTSQKGAIDAIYPGFKYYCTFIKMFYNFFDEAKFSNKKNILCPVPFKQRIKQKDCSPWAIIKISNAFARQSNFLNILTYQKHLQNEIIYCPQEGHEGKMSYSEFVSHLKTEHKDSLKIHITKLGLE